ncbi:MAG: DUF2259 domain-containing protein [Pseudomonadota bacterium]
MNKKNSVGICARIDINFPEVKYSRHAEKRYFKGERSNVKDKKLKQLDSLCQIRRYLAILFGLLCICPLGWANEVADLHFIGFSENGKYLAFEEYGFTHDKQGKRASFSNIFFVDVVNNQYLPKNVKKNRPDKITPVVNRTFLLETRAAAMKAAATTMKEKEINAEQGLKGVSHVIHHPLSDWNARPHQVRFTTGVNPLISKRYQLDLDERITNETCGPDDLNPRILTLILSSEAGEKQSVLQRDTNLPNDRGCITAYRIQDVFLYQKLYIAVFLNIFEATEHGENIRHMVVTGKLLTHEKK